MLPPLSNLQVEDGDLNSQQLMSISFLLFLGTAWKFLCVLPLPISSKLPPELIVC